ncbi:MAG: DUF2934 domain-containing protein [Nitrospirota bacterium]
MMENTSLVSREEEWPPSGLPPNIKELERNPEALAEPLEVKIANRAHEITHHRGGPPGESLASWLEAAREVLSDNSDSPA